MALRDKCLRCRFSGDVGHVDLASASGSSRIPSPSTMTLIRLVAPSVANAEL